MRLFLFLQNFLCFRKTSHPPPLPAADIPGRIQRRPSAEGQQCGAKTPASRRKEAAPRLFSFAFFLAAARAPRMTVCIALF